MLDPTAGTRTQIGVRDRSTNYLYHTIPGSLSGPGSAFAVESASSRPDSLEYKARLLHDRLGHVSYNKIARGIEEGTISSDVSPATLRRLHKHPPACIGCGLGKSYARGYFRSTDVDTANKATKVFQRLCIDTCTIKSSNTNITRYFILIVDEFSKFVWIFPLRRRREGPVRVGQFIRSLRARGCTDQIDVVRSDGAKEFVFSLSGCLEPGTDHEVSAPYHSARSNSLAERSIRTLCQMARCSIQHARAPETVWAACLQHCCHIYNRIPHDGIPKGETPLSLLRPGHPTSKLKHVRTFYCPVFVRSHTIDRSRKFAAMAQLGRFVGYDPTRFGYQVLIQGRIFTRRDVYFFEDIQKAERDLLHHHPGDETPDPSDLHRYLPDSCEDLLQGDIHHPVWTRDEDLPDTNCQSNDEHDFLQPPFDRDHDHADVKHHGPGDSGGADSGRLVVTPDQHYLAHDRGDLLDVKLGSPDLLDGKLGSPGIPGLEPPVPDDPAVAGSRPANTQPPSRADTRSRVPRVPYNHGGAQTDILNACHYSGPPQRAGGADSGHLVLTSDQRYFIRARGDALDVKLRSPGTPAIEPPIPDDPADAAASQPSKENKRPKLYTPRSYRDAMTCADASDWKEAIAAEYANFDKFSVWEPVPQPRHLRNLIRPLLIFKNKYEPNGTLRKRKARLCARGDTQLFGVDYSETFSPTVYSSSLKTFLAVCVQLGLKVIQFDVPAAYLQSSLDSEHELYMAPPPGYPVPHGYVLRLRKAVYGCKQSGRCFYLQFSAFIQSLGFQKSVIDPCVFFRDTSCGKEFIAIHVDDGLIAFSSIGSRDRILKSLEERWGVQEFDDLHFYLGFEFSQTSDCSRITMHSRSYINDLLERYRMQSVNSKHTPMETGLQFPEHVEDHELIDMKIYPYRQLVGSLQYLASNSRPDIAFATQCLARGMSRPSMTHWKAGLRVLAYLKSTSSYGLAFTRGDGLDVQVCCDSDFAGDLSRHSTYGYVTMIGKNIIHWKSKVDKTKISLSTCEAELQAMVEGSKDALYHKNLLCELGLSSAETKYAVVSDNAPALRLCKNNRYRGRAKHIDITQHFLRLAHERGDVHLEHVASDDNVADIFTKALGRVKFQKFRDMIMAPVPDS